MEANEFRIGNLVSVDECGIGTICEIGKDFVELQDGDQWTLAAIGGVELTEELLLRFGFNRKDRGSVSAQFHIGTNPVTHDWLFDLVWMKDFKDYSLSGYPFYRNGHFEIKHVHQLQNLYFALTGEELELK